MALIQCPDCKQDVSDAAPACPRCGRPIAARPVPAGPPLQFQPPPKKSNFAAIGCLTIVVLGVIALMSVGSSGSSGSRSAPSTVDLNASVRFTGTQVHITNGDTFAWSECKVEINDKFNHQLGEVAAGATAQVGALLFADDDGMRFNPFQYAAKEIFIVCQTPRGRGYYTGAWK